eukprot:3567023-Pyramimonas_sp.AAC.1
MAANSVRGLPKLRVELHAGAATGAVDGAPYGPTKRVRGAPNWRWNSMRALPLRPSVELLMGPRNI